MEEVLRLAPYLQKNSYGSWGSGISGERSIP